jgi:hypothetical protein
MIVVLSILGVTIVSLVGCGGDDSSSSTSPVEISSSEPITVDIETDTGEVEVLSFDGLWKTDCINIDDGEVNLSYSESVTLKGQKMESTRQVYEFPECLNGIVEINFSIEGIRLVGESSYFEHTFKFTQGITISERVRANTEDQAYWMSYFGTYDYDDWQAGVWKDTRNRVWDPSNPPEARAPGITGFLIKYDPENNRIKFGDHTSEADAEGYPTDFRFEWYMKQ